MIYAQHIKVNTTIKIILQAYIFLYVNDHKTLRTQFTQREHCYRFYPTLYT